MKLPYIRRSADRGQAMIDWLQSYHTFSFADYMDPAHTHFRNLRVINEDTVAPGQGFGTHPHRDMEIITYVISGQLEHKDSMGNGSVIRAGDVQAMSAGTGVAHSEFNPSKKEPVHLLQIWIFPENKGITPRYVEWDPKKAKVGELTLVASPDGAQNSAQIMTDARLYLVKLPKGAKVAAPVAAGRYGWLQVIKGKVEVEKEKLQSGDGMGWLSEKPGELKAAEETHALLFDLV